MTDASNALDLLHDEDYDVPFKLQNLDHAGMVFSKHRQGMPLNGTWTFTIDRFDTGLRQHWYRDCHQEIEGRTSPWDYDVHNGETIEVPACWNFLKPEYFHYEGSAWFGRRFAHRPSPEGERVMLRIGAAHYDTKVFLNGSFLGNHYGGSTPFFIELTEHLQDDNWLFLCVNNERTLDRVPMRHCDWFNYGGVFREVALFRLPSIFIKDFFVHLVPDGTYGKIKADITLSNPISGDARLQIPALGIEQNLPIQNGEGSITLDASPELWSPDNPQLYDVRASFGDDHIEDRVGL
ncbi:MAG: sugar-binding domain-containing protein, partial [Geminicoccaceae bacterium]